MAGSECLRPLLPTAEELLPDDFYKTPVSTPKTALGPMVVFAAVAYATALIVFILLIIDTSGNYITEVTIMSHDATGTDGYTCEMISKVSNSYTIDSPTDPTLSFQLVNIIESQAQCMDDLASANPCNTPQTYIPGSSSTISYASYHYRAVGLYGNDIAYMVDAEGSLVIYNYVFGNRSYDDWATQFDMYTNSIGIDSSGVVYALSKASGDCANVTCVVATTPMVHSLVVATYDQLYLGIINDNMNNLYLYDDLAIYAVDYVAETQTVLFALDPNGSLFFTTASVYMDPVTSAATIYFSSDNGSAHWAMYRHRAGVTTLLRMIRTDLALISAPLVNDGGAWVYFPCEFNEIYSAVCCLDLSDLSVVYFLSDSLLSYTSTTYPSIAMSSDFSRMFVTAANPASTETIHQYMYYPTTNFYEEILYQTGFAAGWFTCGEEIIYPVPARTSVYNSKCSSNGVVGEVLFQREDTYKFTATDAAAYASRHSASLCPALYEEVCTVVADLPPYSCSKRVYPSVFTVLGTAYANTMFVLSTLLLLFGWALTRLAKQYPPVGTNVHRPESDVTESCKDVEMADVTGTNNPMTNQE